MEETNTQNELKTDIDFEKAIQERKEMLLKMYTKNQDALKHPSLIKEEEEPIDKECNDFGCMVKKTKNLSKKEYTWYLTKKILISTSIIFAIVVIMLIGFLITKRV